MQANEVVERALARAKAAGAEAADAIWRESESVETRVRGSEIDFVKQAREASLGIRVFVSGGSGSRSAVTSTSDVSPEVVERMADETVALAQATAEDPAAGLPEGGFASDSVELELLDASDRSLSVEARIEAARQAESSARETDPRVANSEGSEVGSEFVSVTLGNTAGFMGSYEAAYHSIFSMPIAAENGSMQSDYWMSVARSYAGLETPTAVGREAATRALRRLGARRAPTSEVPVIFDPFTARSLLGNLAGCLNGYAVYRQSSFLGDRLGDEIASPLLTLIDDGRRPGGLGSKPFDGEGLPTRRTTVVEAGQLKSFLLDSYSARKLGAASTGNASRSVGSAPGVSTTNLWIEPGTSSLDEMIASTDQGLLVTGMFGHGFNAVTGDLSRGAAGVWIEGGELKHPVEEITVAGNLGDVLKNVDAVGNELLWLGSVASPALRISRMTVAGD